MNSRLELPTVKIPTPAQVAEFCGRCDHFTKADGKCQAGLSEIISEKLTDEAVQTTLTDLRHVTYYAHYASDLALAQMGATEQQRRVALGLCEHGQVFGESRIMDREGL